MLNIRNYYNWDSNRFGNGVVKWPDWIKYGDGTPLDTHAISRDNIYDDGVVDAI